MECCERVLELDGYSMCVCVCVCDTRGMDGAIKDAAGMQTFLRRARTGCG